MNRHDAAAAARALLPYPSLWPSAVLQAFRLARRGWWRHWPPLPLPDPRWTAFRLETQYGDPGATPAGEDVVEWLRWCRAGRTPRRRVHVRREVVR